MSNSGIEGGFSNEEEENQSNTNVQILSDLENAGNLLVYQEEDDIRQLKLNMNESIENGDFEGAKMIKKKIEDLSASQTDEIIKKIVIGFNSDIQSMVFQYKDKRKTIISQKTNEEISIRDSFSVQFIDLQNSHVNSLMNLENSFLAEYKRYNSKPVGAYQTLLRKADILAKKADYASAQIAQEEAQKIKQEKDQEFQKSYKKQIKYRLKSLLDHQKSEIDDLTKKMETKLSDFTKEKEKTVADIKAVLKNNMKRVYKQYINGLSKQKLSTQQKSLALKQINEHFASLLVEQGLEEKPE